MDAVVQFIRNGLCCVKDLEWFQDTLPWLWDANALPHDAYEIPFPYNETTPLEALIGITQFYAFASMATSGWKLLNLSFGKWQRIQRLLVVAHFTNKRNDDGNSNDGNDDKKNHPQQQQQQLQQQHANKLIHASLVKESHYAARSALIGFLVMAIGIAFFWLFANSFHVTQTPWLGGVPGLIHALTVTEVGLLPLLVYMWRDSGEQLKRADQIQALAQRILQQQHQQQQTTTALDPTDIDLPSLEALTGFLPFWDAGVGPFDLQPLPTEEQLVLDETRKLQTSLRQLTTTTASSSKDDDDDDDENQTSFWQDKAHELQVTSQQVRWEGYREFIYFVLNTVAFYSYMFCILVWYFDDDANKPTHVQYIMFGLDNAAADWHGNFWGDLMWTIEPIVILGTPYLFARLKQNQRAKLQQRAMAATGKTKTE